MINVDDRLIRELHGETREGLLDWISELAQRRCATCRFWTDEILSPAWTANRLARRCARFETTGPLWTDEDLYTEPHFGCSEWQPKAAPELKT